MERLDFLTPDRFFQIFQCHRPRNCIGVSRGHLGSACAIDLSAIFRVRKPCGSKRVEHQARVVSQAASAPVGAKRCVRGSPGSGSAQANTSRRCVTAAYAHQLSGHALQATRYPRWQTGCKCLPGARFSRGAPRCRRSHGCLPSGARADGPATMQRHLSAIPPPGPGWPGGQAWVYSRGCPGPA